MTRRYELAEPRMKPCPRCEGQGGWEISPATWDHEAESGFCEDCGNSGVVYRRVNVYRKKKVLRLAA